jgi:hypothetical protein
MREPGEYANRSSYSGFLCFRDLPGHISAREAGCGNHTAEPLSPVSVGDYLYEVSFPDPLAVPRGHILQVAAKQHVISTHARDQVTHITKVCVKSPRTPDGLF